MSRRSPVVTEAGLGCFSGGKASPLEALASVRVCVCVHRPLTEGWWRVYLLYFALRRSNYYCWFALSGCLSACLSVCLILVEKPFPPVVEPVSPMSPSVVGVSKTRFLFSLYIFFPFFCTFFAYFGLSFSNFPLIYLCADENLQYFLSHLFSAAVKSQQ